MTTSTTVEKNITANITIEGENRVQESRLPQTENNEGGLSLKHIVHKNQEVAEPIPVLSVTTQGGEQLNYKENHTDTPRTRFMKARRNFLCLSPNEESRSLATPTGLRQPALRQLENNTLNTDTKNCQMEVQTVALINENEILASASQKSVEQIGNQYPQRILHRTSSEKSVVSIQEHFKNLCQVVEDISVDTGVQNSDQVGDDVKLTVSCETTSKIEIMVTKCTSMYGHKEVETCWVPNETTQTTRISPNLSELMLRKCASPGLCSTTTNESKIGGQFISNSSSTPARQKSPGLEGLSTVERLSLKRQKAITDSNLENEDLLRSNDCFTSETKIPIQLFNNTQTLQNRQSFVDYKDTTRVEYREDHSQGGRDRETKPQLSYQQDTLGYSLPTDMAMSWSTPENSEKQHSQRSSQVQSSGGQTKRISPRSRLRSSIERLRYIRAKLRDESPPLPETQGESTNSGGKSDRADATQLPQKRLEAIRQRLQVVLVSNEDLSRTNSDKRCRSEWVQTELGCSLQTPKETTWQTPREASWVKDDRTIPEREKVVTFSFPEESDVIIHDAENDEVDTTETASHGHSWISDSSSPTSFTAGDEEIRISSKFQRNKEYQDISIILQNTKFSSSDEPEQEPEAQNCSETVESPLPLELGQSSKKVSGDIGQIKFCNLSTKTPSFGLESQSGEEEGKHFRSGQERTQKLIKHVNRELGTTISMTRISATQVPCPRKFDVKIKSTTPVDSPTQINTTASESTELMTTETYSAAVTRQLLCMPCDMPSRRNATDHSAKGQGPVDIAQGDMPSVISIATAVSIPCEMPSRGNAIDHSPESQGPVNTAPGDMLSVISKGTAVVAADSICKAVYGDEKRIGEGLETNEVCNEMDHGTESLDRQQLKPSPLGGSISYTGSTTICSDQSCEKCTNVDDQKYFPVSSEDKIMLVMSMYPIVPSEMASMKAEGDTREIKEGFIMCQTSKEAADLPKRNQEGENILCSSEKIVRVETEDEDSSKRKQEGDNIICSSEKIVKVETEEELSELKQEEPKTICSSEKIVKVETEEELSELKQEEQNIISSSEKIVKVESKEELSELKQEEPKTICSSEKIVRVESEEEFSELKQEEPKTICSSEKIVKVETEEELSELKQEEQTIISSSENNTDVESEEELSESKQEGEKNTLPSENTTDVKSEEKLSERQQPGETNICTSEKIVEVETGEERKHYEEMSLQTLEHVVELKTEEEEMAQQKHDEEKSIGSAEQKKMPGRKTEGGENHCSLEKIIEVETNETFIISTKYTASASGCEEEQEDKSCSSPSEKPIIEGNKVITEGNNKKHKSLLVAVDIDPHHEEKQKDEFAWAYEVWRKHGLMGRLKGGKKSQLVKKPPSQTPRPFIELHHTPRIMNFIEWDLSPTSTACSRATVGESRAKRFSRESSGNFSNILAQWKEVGDNPFRSPHEHKSSRKRQKAAPIAAFLRAVTRESAPVSDYDSDEDDDDKNDASTTEGDDFDFTKDFDDKNFGSEENYISSSHSQSCACSSSIFSGNDELVNFFLPKLGMACTCGVESEESKNLPSDPTAIEHILRPWQCRFLHSFGITKGDQFVKVHHRSVSALAKGMRKWRKKEEMTTVRTVSCGMALYIWSRTCKAHVRRVRKQLAAGVDEIKPPDAMKVLSSLLDGDETRVSVPMDASRSSLGETTIATEEDVEI